MAVERLVICDSFKMEKHFNENHSQKSIIIISKNNSAIIKVILSIKYPCL